MDVRFYPPPAQPAAAPDAPCLGPSPCLDPYYCNKVNALLLFPPRSGCSVPGGGRRQARRPAAEAGLPGALGSQPRGCRGVRSGSQFCGAAPGFTLHPDSAESDALCSVVPFPLIAIQ